MIKIRKSNERGNFDYGWLNTSHTFSFSHYYDPEFMGFRDLRVINEDYVAGGNGFPAHSHSNMEILSYVVDGKLEHKDSMGTGSIIHKGDFQLMCAGDGVTHSEYNPSSDEKVHFYQIWIKPDAQGYKQNYQQKHFDEYEKKILVASKDGRDGSLQINQDIKIFIINLDSNNENLKIDSGRYAYVQVVEGQIDLNGNSLSTSDGAFVENETSLKMESNGKAKIFVFDMK